MSVPNPKPKRQEILALPPELTPFFQEVHALIAREDDLAMWESDDLLQAESIYGGLINQDGTAYGFTYFPEESVETEWEIVLDKTDIESIAKGEKTTLSLWACQFPECGSKFSDENQLCFEHDYDLQISGRTQTSE